jgi:hypothetical protein
MGFADALARPGGNITKVSLYVFELDSKRLQLLKEAIPSLLETTNKRGGLPN